MQKHLFKMNKITTSILLIVFIILFSACQKTIDEDIFVPNPGQVGLDTTWYSNITDAMPITSLKSSLLLDSYADSIEVGSASDTIYTPSGLQCIFPANSCVNASGVAVSGKIKVAMCFVQKKGDMIRMNKPTTSNNRILINGAVIYVHLKKENNDVFLAPSAKLQMRFTDTLSATLKAFTGVEAATGYNWQENNDVLNNSAGHNSQGYELHSNKLDWTNYSYFFDTVGINRSILSASLPSSYTNANSSVYLVFNDMRSVVALTADVPSKKFVSGKLPDGKMATLVVISKQGNDYFFGQQTITLGAQTTVPITPVISNLAKIKTALDNL
jgi:hypothetical protein